VKVGIAVAKGAKRQAPTAKCTCTQLPNAAGSKENYTSVGRMKQRRERLPFPRCSSFKRFGKERFDLDSKSG
jgi:hypothetical protein